MPDSLNQKTAASREQITKTKYMLLQIIVNLMTFNCQKLSLLRHFYQHFVGKPGNVRFQSFNRASMKAVTSISLYLRLVADLVGFAIYRNQEPAD